MSKFNFLGLILISGFLTSCEDKDPEATPDIDLVAQTIAFSLEQTSKFDGVATITGIVKNAGEGDFRSSEGQQVISLHENFSGGGSGDIVAQKTFTDLNAGDTLNISYTTQWSHTFEFPPTYVLRINYDPDIYIDDNPENDDIDPSNNRKERSGAEINDLFGNDFIN